MVEVSRSLIIVLIASFLLAACAPAVTSVSPPAPTQDAEEPIYLAIIWHQHQPVYYRDPVTNLYARPWVRVHAAKDYVDMATMLDDYPEIHATFNLTPSLIRQLDDFAAGAKDLYWSLAEIPANQLSDEQKRFILDRFFDTNREIIGRFPRYRELLALRDGSPNALHTFSEQDYRDLQVLFNLAWTDPDWLAQEPLAPLVAKGEGFSEADKAIVFGEHLRLIEEVIPVHRRLQDAGQIEVTMTPFAHPILPLLVTTQLAREALPELELPGEPFVYGQDATAQVDLGVQFYEDHFGVPPRGMWPAEGSVAQEIVTMVSQAGIQWIASDEGVLAASLGLQSFERDSEDVVLEADTLYRPYYVQGLRGDPVAILFRDIDISDKVGFTYSGMDGELAATDFVTRIHAIRQKLIDSDADGPHLVTVLLDGENAWEYYKNDGKEFLNSLYAQLSADPLVKTVTPSEFLALAPEQPAIDDLWAGSWINQDFSTWIGEEEENTAWELLAQTRAWLQPYITGVKQDLVSEAQLAEALEQMYIAEGSDWFWWYGADQNSGNDETFDEQFRSTLKTVYAALGEEAPLILDVPIIPQLAEQPDEPSTGLISPTIDGHIDVEEEWVDAAFYFTATETSEDGVPIGGLFTGFDAQHLYLALRTYAVKDHSGSGAIDIYFSLPGAFSATGFSEAGSLLGFPGELRIRIDRGTGSAEAFTIDPYGVWTSQGELEQVAVLDGQIELAVPLATLGNADTGNGITLRAFYQIENDDGLIDVDFIPDNGPALLAVPDLGNTEVVLEINDPEGDDHGPGAYTYPQDIVFNAGNFDILNFQVGTDEENVVFKFVMRGPVDNPWGSPNGLALQTFDIYIDSDQDGQGGLALLPGRNLVLGGSFYWDHAIHVEGWTAGIYMPSEDEGISQVASSSEFQILADPGQRKITVRVPKAILGDNPEAWAYAAMVLSQEGFPSGGVLRVRDVLVAAEQWRLGGGPSNATNHTRVIDLVWPEAGVQEEWLSVFEPVSTTQTELTSADFAQILMFSVVPQ